MVIFAKIYLVMRKFPGIIMVYAFTLFSRKLNYYSEAVAPLDSEL